MAGHRSVRAVVPAVEKAEGAGARVRRAIGTARLPSLTPFLMLDHFSVRPGAGFPDHPHRGQETVTYLLRGGMDHEDFAGHRGSLGPGDLQFMTAGRGIVHAEMPAAAEGRGPPGREDDDSTAGSNTATAGEDDDGDASVGLQLWLDLPAALKACEPAYHDLGAASVPSVAAAPGAVVKVIAGRSGAVAGPGDGLTRTPLWLLDVRLSPGAALEQPLPRGWTALAYVLDGRVGFGQGDAVDRFHCVVFEDDADAVRVEADAAAVGTSHLVIIAGPPLDQPIVQYGPFVLTSREAVAQALHDYRSCTNGFERARGWRSDIGRSMMP